MNYFKKEILTHSELYIVKFTKNPSLGYLLFIHGGPGYNCGVIEYLIEHESHFNSLNYNIILYDQRGCGRSPACENSTSHMDNVNDLYKINEYIKSNYKINIKGYIGHSYGAKLLFDFYNKYTSTIPGIFVSTAESILIPRLNNIILDLNYLKKTNPDKHKKILYKMDHLTIKKVWELTEELAPIFKENTERDSIYWASTDIYKIVEKVKDIIRLPVNADIFMSVRKDLYSREINYAIAIEQLDIPYLWINGFHDFIMNGSEGLLSKNKKVTTFYHIIHI